MSEEVIDRVDELVRKNNVKYKGKQMFIQMSKAKKLIGRHSSNIKNRPRKIYSETMPHTLNKAIKKQFKNQNK